MSVFESYLDGVLGCKAGEVDSFLKGFYPGLKVCPLRSRQGGLIYDDLEKLYRANSGFFDRSRLNCALDGLEARMRADTSKSYLSLVPFDPGTVYYFERAVSLEQSRLAGSVIHELLHSRHFLNHRASSFSFWDRQKLYSTKSFVQFSEDFVSSVWSRYPGLRFDKPISLNPACERIVEVDGVGGLLRAAFSQDVF